MDIFDYEVFLSGPSNSFYALVSVITVLKFVMLYVYVIIVITIYDSVSVNSILKFVILA